MSKAKLLVLLGSLDSNLMCALLAAIKVAPCNHSPSDLLEQLEVETEDRGVKHLLSELGREHVVSLYRGTEGAEMPVVDGVRERLTSLAAMRKRLEDRVAELHAAEWLAERTPTELAAMAAALDVDEKGTKDELVKRIADEVYAMGSQTIFHCCDRSLLIDVCHKVGMKGASTKYTKNELCDALVAGELAKPQERPAKIEPVISKERPEIERGISAADLHQHYYIGELEQYCREHGLKYNEAKSRLIVHIRKYLEDPSYTGYTKGRGPKPHKEKKAAVAAPAEKAAEEAPKEEEKKVEEKMEVDEAPKKMTKKRPAAAKDEKKEESAKAEAAAAEPPKKKAKTTEEAPKEDKAKGGRKAKAEEKKK